METMAEILNKLPATQNPEPKQAPTIEEQVQFRVDEYNNRPGKLVGFDCPKCKNKGYIARVNTDYGYPTDVVSECECLQKRKYLTQLRQSGLETAISNYKFKNFIAKSDWQRDMKKRCDKYSKESENEWLFLGGQSGCGKTHLCTAICGRYLKKGIPVIYMMWREDSTTMKQAVNNNPDYYNRKMDKYKSVEILYIDDLFKSGKTKDGQIAVSPADINLAFEILNYRAFKGMKTIISSELTIDELRLIDEAIAGRIYEKAISKGYGASIAYDGNKNYRFTEA